MVDVKLTGTGREPLRPPKGGRRLQGALPSSFVPGEQALPPQGEVLQLVLQPLGVGGLFGADPVQVKVVQGLGLGPLPLQQAEGQRGVQTSPRLPEEGLTGARHPPPPAPVGGGDVTREGRWTPESTDLGTGLSAEPVRASGTEPFSGGPSDHLWASLSSSSPVVKPTR
ncbi:hypothetical protein EYF80_017496 [Liparis tanakae]|uniref:Uncharacterized protein n=1 Tax=Liparis tanakae TaxID=230148 RepID=A0A4Z2I4M8_9TELE|nr:hypothetical protein EYF80_017496 [Liparis tanakae]